MKDKESQEEVTSNLVVCVSQRKHLATSAGWGQTSPVAGRQGGRGDRGNDRGAGSGVASPARLPVCCASFLCTYTRLCENMPCLPRRGGVSLKIIECTSFCIH